MRRVCRQARIMSRTFGEEAELSSTSGRARLLLSSKPARCVGSLVPDATVSVPSHLDTSTAVPRLASGRREMLRDARSNCCALAFDGSVYVRSLEYR